MKTEELKVILSQDYGWGNLDSEKHKWFVDELIKDILSITKKTTNMDIQK
jgi:hypothetical protein